MKKLMITKELIASLKPCSNRHENYLKFYGNKQLTVAQFMGRKNITQDDKMWVAFRIMDKDKIKLAAADIAESVLSVYETKYPNDNRPRLAIQAARTGDKDTATHAAANAAYSAAYAANAAYAAHAAYHAASAAHAATHAASAAYAAHAASHAAIAGTDRTAQEKLIRKIVMRYLK